MDLALNKLQLLICQKNPTNQSTKYQWRIKVLLYGTQNVSIVTLYKYNTDQCCFDMKIYYDLQHTVTREIDWKNYRCHIETQIIPFMEDETKQTLSLFLHRLSPHPKRDRLSLVPKLADTNSPINCTLSDRLWLRLTPPLTKWPLKISAYISPQLSYWLMWWEHAPLKLSRLKVYSNILSTPISKLIFYLLSQPISKQPNLSMRLILQLKDLN